jgi:hypothetical protein
MDHPVKGGDAPPAYSEREAAEVDAPHEHVAIEGSASVDGNCSTSNLQSSVC